MDLISVSLGSSLGTITVRTPSSMEALIWSILAYSRSLNLREKLPLLRSTRYHVSVFCSSWRLLCPLIWMSLPSSISTFSSSFLKPGTSAMNTCSVGVSFQSMLVPSEADDGSGRRPAGKPWLGNSSNACCENECQYGNMVVSENTNFRCGFRSQERRVKEGLTNSAFRISRLGVRTLCDHSRMFCSDPRPWLRSTCNHHNKKPILVKY